MDIIKSLNKATSYNIVDVLNQLLQNISKLIDVKDIFLPLRKSLSLSMTPTVIQLHIEICRSLPYIINDPKEGPETLRYWTDLVQLVQNYSAPESHQEILNFSFWMLETLSKYTEHDSFLPLVKSLYDLIMGINTNDAAINTRVVKLLLALGEEASQERIKKMVSLWVNLLSKTLPRTDRSINVGELLFSRRLSLCSILPSVWRAWEKTVEEGRDGGVILKVFLNTLGHLIAICKDYATQMSPYYGKLAELIISMRRNEIIYSYPTEVSTALSNVTKCWTLFLEANTTNKISVINVFEWKVEKNIKENTLNDAMSRMLIYYDLMSRVEAHDSLSMIYIIRQIFSVLPYLSPIFFNQEKYPNIYRMTVVLMTQLIGHVNNSSRDSSFLCDMEQIIFPSICHSSILVSEFALYLWCYIIGNASTELQERYASILIELSKNFHANSPLLVYLRRIFHRTIPLLEYRHQEKIYSTLNSKSLTMDEKGKLMFILPARISSINRIWNQICSSCIQISLTKCREVLQMRQALPDMANALCALLRSVEASVERANSSAIHPQFLDSNIRSNIIGVITKILHENNPEQVVEKYEISKSASQTTKNLISLTRYFLTDMSYSQFEEVLLWVESHLNASHRCRITIAEFLGDCSRVITHTMCLNKVNTCARILQIFEILFNDSDWTVFTTACSACVQLIEVLPEDGDHVLPDTIRDYLIAFAQAESEGDESSILKQQILSMYNTLKMENTVNGNGHIEKGNIIYDIQNWIELLRSFQEDIRDNDIQQNVHRAVLSLNGLYDCLLKKNIQII